MSGGRWQPPHPAREVPKCAWPRCPKATHNDLPLCWAHLQIAHELWEKHRDAPRTAKLKYAGTSQENVVPIPALAPNPGTIYYLRSGAYFKIGWTADLEKRMRNYPPDTALLATHPGTKADERALHRRFGHLLSHGREWFMLSPEIHDHVERVVAEHGAPPVVDFTARRATRTAGRQTQYVGGPNRGNLAPRSVRG